MTKLNAAGTAIIYSTFLGSGESSGQAIAVDASGNAYITGYTKSSTFPAVKGYSNSLGGGQDAFLAELNAQWKREFVLDLLRRHWQRHWKCHRLGCDRTRLHRRADEFHERDRQRRHLPKRR